MAVDLLSIRLPKEVIEWLDSLVHDGIYQNRSEAIRDFSRDYLEQVMRHS